MNLTNVESVRILCISGLVCRYGELFTHCAKLTNYKSTESAEVIVAEGIENELLTVVALMMSAQQLQLPTKATFSKKAHPKLATTN